LLEDGGPVRDSILLLSPSSGSLSSRAGRAFLAHYTYPFMELRPCASAMQHQMIREIEAADPRYRVFVSATRS
jgi:hypothetical protein